MFAEFPQWLRAILQVVKGEYFSVKADSSFPRGDAEDSGFNGGNIVDYWSMNIGYGAKYT